MVLHVYKKTTTSKSDLVISCKKISEQKVALADTVTSIVCKVKKKNSLILSNLLLWPSVQ